MKKPLIALSCLFILAGCGTNNRTGIVYDPRPLAVINDDQSLRHQLELKFADDPAFKDSHISASSFNHNVLLVGETPVSSVRVKAEKIARSFPKVGKIYNEVQISDKNSRLKQHSRDTWITTKVKANLVTNLGLASNRLKVVTERGSVYLLGDVTREQADLAISVVRRTSGVQRVVKLFEYSKQPT